jgi:hypothetical protein
MSVSSYTRPTSRHHQKFSQNPKTIADLDMFALCWLQFSPMKVDSQKRAVLKWIAAFIHVLGVWMVPIMVLWGWTSVYGVHNFSSQEVPHLLLGTLLYASLFVTPLLLGPPGYEQPDLTHQMYESAFIFAWSTFGLKISTVAHLSGIGDHFSSIPVVDWFHLQIGLSWMVDGIFGMLYAQKGIKSSVLTALSFKSATTALNMYPQASTGPRSHCRALHSFTVQARLAITKFLHCWLPPKHNLHKHNPSTPLACGLCQAPDETDYHVCRCPHTSSAPHPPQGTNLVLESKGTNPTITTILTPGCRNWQAAPPLIFKPQSRIQSGRPHKVILEQIAIADHILRGRLSLAWGFCFMK